MTNQSPAEALRQQLEELCNKYGYFMGLAYDDTDGIIQTYPQGRVMDELVKFVTAYAATVEREAVEDTIWKIMSPKTEGLFDDGDLFIKRKPIEDAIIGMIGYEKYKALQEAVDARLAALQGPQQ